MKGTAFLEGSLETGSRTRPCFHLLAATLNLGAADRCGPGKGMRWKVRGQQVQDKGKANSLQSPGPRRWAGTRHHFGYFSAVSRHLKFMAKL